MLRFNFISGLPRSGSTLLASLLSQNPECHAHIMSPVGHIFTATLNAMSPDNEAAVFLDDDDRAEILEGLFNSYYARSTRPFVFDNNRRWTANVAALATVFPLAKVICCVRSPLEITDSFEKLFAAHPLAVSKIIGYQSNQTPYGRMGHYYDPAGVIGFAYNALKEAWYGPHRDRLVLLEYDHLARDPLGVMKELTELLQLPKFDYNPNKIAPLPGVAEFDARIGTPGLHDLKGKVVYQKRTSMLPPDLIARMPPAFWRVNKEATKSS